MMIKEIHQYQSTHKIAKKYHGERNRKYHSHHPVTPLLKHTLLNSKDSRRSVDTAAFLSLKNIMELNLENGAQNDTITSILN